VDPTRTKRSNIEPDKFDNNKIVYFFKKIESKMLSFGQTKLGGRIYIFKLLRK
jgi:hypothetical protein